MIALVGAVLIGGILLLVILFALERKKCPVCQRRRVAMRFTDGYTDGETNIVSYRCKKCRTEFRTFNGGPLIPREAFDDGAREPLPQAKVRR
jgi:transposase-like protein